MSDYTKSVMWRIRLRVEASGISLHVFGKRMGYEVSAKQSAWQFLNSTEDPRLSMLERAAAALGMSVEELVRAPSQTEIARTFSRLYSDAADGVMQKGHSRDQAMLSIGRGAKEVLRDQPDDVVKAWDRWRIDTGHGIYGMKFANKEEFAAALRSVAGRLLVDGLPSSK